MDDDKFFGQATCVQERLDHELFFPEQTNGVDREWREQVAEARAVCARCPVIDECLERALEVPTQAGIQGGLTATARYRLRRAREEGVAVNGMAAALRHEQDVNMEKLL